jgi:fatty acid desaturase
MTRKSSVSASDTQTVRSLSGIHHSRTLFKLAQIVLALSLTLIFARWGADYNVLPDYIIAFLIATWAQHAIFEELHEGAHYRLVSVRHINEQLTGFYGSLIGISVGNFRARHNMHHRYFGTSQDPDLPQYQTCPIGVKAWLRYLAENFTGYGAVKSLLGAKSTLTTGAPSRQHPGLTLALQLMLFALGVAVGLPFFYFIFWFAPLITLTYGISHFRTLLEHYNTQTWLDPVTGETCYGAFYDFSPGIQRHLLGAQFGYNYHGSHHAEPSIPNYNLNQIAHEDYREVPENLIRSTTYLTRISEILALTTKARV